MEALIYCNRNMFVLQSTVCSMLIKNISIPNPTYYWCLVFITDKKKEEITKPDSVQIYMQNLRLAMKWVI